MRGILVVFVVAAIAAAAWAETPGVTAEDGTLVFRPPPSKQMTLPEVRAPGKLYDPPEKLYPIPTSSYSWKTPKDAAAAEFSALHSNDVRWILECCAPGDRARLREALQKQADDPEGPLRVYRDLKVRRVTGEATYKGYALVFCSKELLPFSYPVVYKETSDGWKTTFDLAADPGYNAIIAALNAQAFR